jgi:hypothetical protein
MSPMEPGNMFADQESAGADRQDAGKGCQSETCRQTCGKETQPNALALWLALGRRLLLVPVAGR